jgi:flagellar biogenesis protein FliO
MEGLALQFAGTAAALLLVLPLAWGVLRLLARTSTGRSTGGTPLQLRQVLALGARERLVLVRSQGETLLLGVTANGITVLQRTKDTDGADNPPP